MFGENADPCWEALYKTLCTKGDVDEFYWLCNMQETKPLHTWYSCCCLPLIINLQEPLTLVIVSMPSYAQSGSSSDCLSSASKEPSRLMCARLSCLFLLYQHEDCNSAIIVHRNELALVIVPYICLVDCLCLADLCASLLTVWAIPNLAVFMSWTSRYLQYTKCKF